MRRWPFRARTYLPAAAGNIVGAMVAGQCVEQVRFDNGFAAAECRAAGPATPGPSPAGRDLTRRGVPLAPAVRLVHAP